MKFWKRSGTQSWKKGSSSNSGKRRDPDERKTRKKWRTGEILNLINEAADKPMKWHICMIA